MNQVFRACRAIACAEALRRLGKNGANYLTEAAGALDVSGLPELRPEAASLRAITSQWASRAGEIGAIFNRVQMEGGPVLRYHAASAGWCFGLVITACDTAGPDTNIAEIVDGLDKAKAHTMAYAEASLTGKEQLQALDLEFRTLTGAINRVVGTSADVYQQLRVATQLAQSLSDRIGNAMR